MKSSGISVLQILENDTIYILREGNSDQNSQRKGDIHEEVDSSDEQTGLGAEQELPKCYFCSITRYGS